MKFRLPRTRRYRIYLYLLSLFLILVALDLLLVRIGRHITIAKDTTSITSPLKPDGTPDYIQAIDDLYSAGITDDNNAAPLLLSAFDPDTMLSKQCREQIYARLHMPLHPAPVPFQDSYSLFLHPDGHIIDGQQNDDEIDLCRKSLWKESDHPSLAQWLRTADHALDLLYLAANKPRYYIPYGRPANTQFVAELLLPSLGKYYEIAYCACARALLRANTGDFEGARSDLLAVHHLARLVGQGQFLIERLVALGIDRAAADADATLAAAGILTASQARELLTDLQMLSPLPPLADALSIQRYQTLEALFYASQHGTGNAIRRFLDPHSESIAKLLIHAVNFVPSNIDRAMREVNDFMDREIAVAHTDNYAEQLALNRDLLDRLNRLVPSSNFARFFSPAHAMAANLIPYSARPVQLYRAQEMELDLTRLALALSAYHADHHAYPASLAALTPAYLPAIPEDLFINQPLHYTLTPPATGYTLYSVGPNMQDDAGQTRQHHDPAHPTADDLTVTAPL